MILHPLLGFLMMVLKSCFICVDEVFYMRDILS